VDVQYYRTCWASYAVDVDRRDPDQLTDVDKLMQQLVSDYKSMNISAATHPTTRSFAPVLFCPLLNTRVTYKLTYYGLLQGMN